MYKRPDNGLGTKRRHAVNGSWRLVPIIPAQDFEHMSVTKAAFTDQEISPSASRLFAPIGEVGKAIGARACQGFTKR